MVRIFTVIRDATLKYKTLHKYIPQNTYNVRKFSSTHTPYMYSIHNTLQTHIHKTDTHPQNRHTPTKQTHTHKTDTHPQNRHPPTKQTHTHKTDTPTHP